jgi:hypothetical protein
MNAASRFSFFLSLSSFLSLAFFLDLDPFFLFPCLSFPFLSIQLLISSFSSLLLSFFLFWQQQQQQQPQLGLSLALGRPRQRVARPPLLQLSSILQQEKQVKWSGVRVAAAAAAAQRQQQQQRQREQELQSR